MDKITQLKQKRSAIVKELRTMQQDAEKNGKALDQDAFDKKFEESQELRLQINQEQRMLDLENELNQKDDPATGAIDPAQRSGNDDKVEYRTAFFKALRGQTLTTEERAKMEEQRAMSATTGEDGGYIIPEDVTTNINQLRNTVDSLEQYVGVETVTTNKGARTLERRAASTPFAPLSEYGDPNALQEINAPQFDRLEYDIEDYGGFLPVPNTLLADTDQALENYLRQWIAKKSRATRNHLILQELDKFEKKNFASHTEIKTTLNVDLDPVFSQGATIFTNQDGFNHLDQLEDGNGRPLLTPNPQNATQKMLHGRPIVVLSNDTLASVENRAPIIIGNLKEAIVLFDRQQMSLDMTTTGGNAWRSNTTEFRAIEREDVTTWDDKAIVYGTLPLSEVVA